MSIIYALIAKENNGEIINLCSYDAAHGNYPSVTYEILKSVKIVQNITYKYNEEYNFHILKDGILLFVCLTDSGLKVKNAFLFLEELRKKFKEKYSNEEITMAKKYEFSPSFSETFQAQVAISNSYREQDKKQILKKELTHLQEIMSENIDKVLQRQEKVQLIVKKTAKLDSIADEIKKNASQIKKKSFWRNHKWKVFGTVAIGSLVAAMVIIL